MLILIGRDWPGYCEPLSSCLALLGQCGPQAAQLALLGDGVCGHGGRHRDPGVRSRSPEYTRILPRTRRFFLSWGAGLRSVIMLVKLRFLMPDAQSSATTSESLIFFL